jgi:predicted N-acetyltransferase YhbS
MVGKPILLGEENRDGWSEATCHSSGAKIHYQVCRDGHSSGDQLGDLRSSIHENHAHLIGRAFADTSQRQVYSEEDAVLTAAMLREKNTISFSVWAFGSCRAKEKTLAGTAVLTRAIVDQHSNQKVFALALIAVDRQWRQYGIGRNLLERIEKELRDQEKAHWIVAHGLRPNMYLKNGYQLDPQELPCPFKPKDRMINFFCKGLHSNASLDAFKKPKPAFIRLASDSLRKYYSDYQPVLLRNNGSRLAGSRTAHPEANSAEWKMKPPTTDSPEKITNTTSQKEDSPDSYRPQKANTRTTWTSYSKQLTITCINETNIIKRTRRNRHSPGGKQTRHCRDKR